MRRGLTIILVLGGVATVGTVRSYGQCTYDITFLAYPVNCGLGYPITAGLSINEHGDVAGRWKCATSNYDEGFLWTAESGFTTLPRPSGVNSLVAADINDAGTIVGTYTNETGFKGFVYEDGRYTELPPLPGGSWSWASAITNGGQVVGTRSIRDGVAPYNAFVWSSKEGFVDLGVMIGPVSFGMAVNETGAVTGWTGNGSSTNDGFLQQEGGLLLLGPVPGGCTSMPWAISDNGVVVGAGLVPMKGSPIGENRAFMWRNGQYTMLPMFPGHIRSIAYGISPHGRQIVGVSGFTLGFLWQDGVMYDLNDLTEAPPGFVIRNAATVNNRGVIVAIAHSPGGEILTFLMTPLDQPLGDLDNDCHVGIVDFLMLLAHWGETDSPADLNGDGTVDEADFRILLGNWG